MPGAPYRRRPGWGLASIGFDYAAAVAGFALLGFWFDRHYETSPWGVVVGSVLGLVGGTYNFIRASLRAVRGGEDHHRDDDEA